MTFNIYQNVNGRVLTLKVEQVYLSNQIQRLKISGKNKYVVIQNDQPLLDKVNVKKVAPWKLVEGKVENPAVFVYTLREIDRKISQLKGFEKQQVIEAQKLP